MSSNTAYFARNPFSLEDLQRLHPLYKREPYVIEKTIILKRIDFENFITDMCADRWFIEENIKLMYIHRDKLWHCILVKQKGREDGVLVMSKGRSYPQFVAYYSQ